MRGYLAKLRRPPDNYGARTSVTTIFPFEVDLSKFVSPPGITRWAFHEYTFVSRCLGPLSFPSSAQPALRPPSPPPPPLPTNTYPPTPAMPLIKPRLPSIPHAMDLASVSAPRNPEVRCPQLIFFPCS